MGAFPGAGLKNRVCIVYVRINLPACRRLMQKIEAPVADGQMVHLSRTAGTRPNGGQFGVTPECAIEQNSVGFVNGTSQFIC